MLRLLWRRANKRKIAGPKVKKVAKPSAAVAGKQKSSGVDHFSPPSSHASPTSLNNHISASAILNHLARLGTDHSSSSHPITSLPPYLLPPHTSSPSSVPTTDNSRLHTTTTTTTITTTTTTTTTTHEFTPPPQPPPLRTDAETVDSSDDLDDSDLGADGSTASKAMLAQDNG
jgi:hypothetical protein